ncbi:MAG: hypothetical protein OKBPIBMD_02122 [Chlorobi bacterium]|nr:MAG: hypothetical protein F9K28_11440 [Bacteroidota bacterium]KXK36187.1 MAG: hypothetical protein UZ06_CHB003000051 [Chlorobi bacterium OLB6]MBV6464629.1 hypothetical protein [Chlorobiota bacterium]MBZ0194876.1 hypothetical protein [Candidatus Kapabacteria bacterium]WKZ78891.1 MAG: hypothetical protein QY319_05665 [Candidatus Kapabacteria bacterium]
MVGEEDLIIPVYLNQRIVFDLVAMLQGGIASVTQVTSSHTGEETKSKEISTGMGLSSALSTLLRIDFAGKAVGGTKSESEETRSEQRIHTPASLFITLRALLRDRQFIVNDGSGIDYKPGDIVEFVAVLERNPLLENTRAFIEFVDMMSVFGQSDQRKGSTQPSELKKVKTQLESFVKAIQDSSTVDLTTRSMKSYHRAVITLEQQYLNDPKMADLIDGTFRVLGKIIRVVRDGEEPISLNRKSAMGKLPPAVLSELSRAFADPALGGFDLSPIEWEIAGPAIQVIPVAIFA